MKNDDKKIIVIGPDPAREDLARMLAAHVREGLIILDDVNPPPPVPADAFKKWVRETTEAEKVAQLAKKRAAPNPFNSGRRRESIADMMTRMAGTKP